MSNRITDDDGLGLNQLSNRYFYDFSSSFEFSINIHEYANSIFCLSDHEIKGMCPGCNLVPSLIVSV